MCALCSCTFQSCSVCCGISAITASNWMEVYEKWKTMKACSRESFSHSNPLASYLAHPWMTDSKFNTQAFFSLSFSLLFYFLLFFLSLSLLFSCFTPSMRKLTWINRANFTSCFFFKFLTKKKKNSNSNFHWHIWIPQEKCI